MSIEGIPNTPAPEEGNKEEAEQASEKMQSPETMAEDLASRERNEFAGSFGEHFAQMSEMAGVVESQSTTDEGREIQRLLEEGVSEGNARAFTQAQKLWSEANART